MIKINTTTTDKAGAVIASGSIINIVPRFKVSLEAIDLYAYVSEESLEAGLSTYMIAELPSMGFKKQLTPEELLTWLNASDTFTQINQWVVDYLVLNGFNADDLEIIDTI